MISSGQVHPMRGPFSSGQVSTQKDGISDYSLTQSYAIILSHIIVEWVVVRTFQTEVYSVCTTNCWTFQTMVYSVYPIELWAFALTEVGESRIQGCIGWTLQPMICSVSPIELWAIALTELGESRI